MWLHIQSSLWMSWSGGRVQAKFCLEQQCQQLQQRAAGLSAKVHSLAGRCEEAEADAQALQRRLGLEAERVRLVVNITIYVAATIIIFGAVTINILWRHCGGLLALPTTSRS